MESSKEAIPINRAQLNNYLDSANRLLQTVKWRAKPDVLPKESKSSLAAGTPQWRESAVSQQKEEQVSIIQGAKRAGNDSFLFSEAINHALLSIRCGIQLGAYLSQLYAKASNLETLIEQNQRGQLTDTQKTEFRAKYQTASAIALFSLAYYVVSELENKSDELSNVAVEFSGIPEISLRSPIEAFECSMFYYGLYLEKSSSVLGEKELVKLTLLYFRGLLDELKLRDESLQYTEPFTMRTYKLEGSEFSINGFEAELTDGRTSVEFNRVTFEQIVGNRDAKHYARRLAERLVCYDPVIKKNPMYELGGFSVVSMGYGEPGTGKSMIIAAVATLLDEYCKILGVPFLFWPMPDTIVSTFQGGSAERMMKWMSALKDSARIIYAPIDDAENNLEERTRQGVSAGVREVIGVFLRNTEGAYAIHRGNAVIELYTNLPDQIDKAVLSRIRRRVYIGGAKEAHDFLDQDYLWWKRYRALDPSFVNCKDSDGYIYLEKQKLVSSLTKVSEDISEPKEESIQNIFSKVREKYDVNQHEFFSVFFARVKTVYPLFTSRDVRNIQEAVDSRIMDFDFPADWLENPEVFFRQSYGRKVDMIKELMRENMRGLSFAQIRLQETIRYLDNMVRIADTGRKRRILEAAEYMRIQREANLEVFGGSKERSI